MSRVTLEIAGFHLAFTCEDALLLDALYRRYNLFLSQGESQFQIDIEWNNTAQLTKFSIPNISIQNNQIQFSGREFHGSCDLSKQCASLELGMIAPVDAVDYFLRVVFAFIVFQEKGMMVHGAGIIHKGNGYLFMGSSGSGKTTVARSSVTSEVLNDDLIVLLPEEKAWRMYSTPFYNPTQMEPKKITALLIAMYRLVQDKSVYLESFKPGEALAEFIANIPVITSDLGRTGLLMERCMHLLRGVPVYKLHFLPDDSFWQVIDV